ncbi:uncharacterized protein LOC107045803 [Diachasma alloeum]|uniref:uncharacterized protein LOC107045803 n=1 Tax=Diachasma alloeum TaxID=454923 RepID=UPI0007384E78|nr:uncharacterized protein LOC107045803 [Diachasma alloeum]
MVSTDDMILAFYIACGVGGGCIIILFILVGVIFIKLNRFMNDGSNRLNSQRNMMADFCYSNPTIVPGEELSRRGYSMYNGSDSISIQPFSVKLNDYGNYQEARSKF